ncbi:MAG TPA: ferredoxin [Acidimicrobiales bacterium]|nr:ferredoxin [Acidimicrobiales bacterium]
MKIRVDRQMCQGHALCNAAAPELFTLDADGYSNVDIRDVPAGMEDAARRGLLRCPERAITIEETTTPEQPHG